MKKLILPVSLILNVVLIAAAIWLVSKTRETAFNSVADFTEAEVRIQKHVLEELNSNDPERIEKLKGMLEQNISQGTQAAANWRSAADNN